jgi:2-polyprenyl-6-methoxyphenol hydroxylase-like FAD-dependent oxidoreductase
MGLLSEVRSRLVDEAGVAFVDARGRARATIMANTSGRGGSRSPRNTRSCAATWCASSTTRPRTTRTDRFIDGMEIAESFYSQEVPQVRAGTWSKGRVVLVGDAAHRPTSGDSTPSTA